MATILERINGVWTRHDVSALAGQVEFKAVNGLSASNVWVVGEAGTVLHFDGKVWSRYDAETTQTLNALWVDSLNSELWAVGNAGTIRSWSVTDIPSSPRKPEPRWRPSWDPTQLHLLTITGLHLEKPWGYRDAIEARGTQGLTLVRPFTWCPID